MVDSHRWNRRILGRRCRKAPQSQFLTTKRGKIWEKDRLRNPRIGYLSRLKRVRVGYIQVAKFSFYVFQIKDLESNSISYFDHQNNSSYIISINTISSKNKILVKTNWNQIQTDHITLEISSLRHTQKVMTNFCNLIYLYDVKEKGLLKNVYQSQ